MKTIQQMQHTPEPLAWTPEYGRLLKERFDEMWMPEPNQAALNRFLSENPKARAIIARCGKP